ncbi:hypothetical protein [Paenibacillus sp.]|uniref:hypothetical protein n=1 Tax=Paenibacillus sp. TaxID=58172 RepID=UPI002D4ADC95|nr:hypothetical protein [Paenibacillus sp.]HZG88283.1 hypothetical protein [Paenibacillus sp.]
MTRLNWFRQRAPLRAALAALLAAAFAAGCEETQSPDDSAEAEARKARIAAAYERNDSLDHYRFEGSFAFAAAPDAAAAGIVPTLADGLSWSGVYYRNPLRLEADIRPGGDADETAAGDAARETIPLLVRDGTLFISIPAINRPDEYLSVRLEEANGGAAAGVASLVQAAGAVDALAERIFDELDPRWIAPAEPAGAAGGERFVAAVTADNADAMTAAVQAGFAAWARSLPAELGAPALPEGAGIRLAEGGALSFALGADGTVAEQLIELAFVSGEDAAEAGTLRYELRLSEANGSPALTKEAPAATVPLEHVLAFLKAGSGGAEP